MSLLLGGCSALKDASQQPIIAIDDSPVTTEEFMYVFEKNNINQNQQQVSEQDILEYLDLFVNFRLKVTEAESLGLHRDSSFINELEGYRKQLAQPYLTETDLLDSLTKVTYDRLQQEVNASHILITVAENASAADTAVAYKKIVDLKEKIQKGANFGSLAQQLSEDPSAKQNQGNLGYFSAMQMVFAFENAAYSLSPGQISDPVRTRFGYHLIQVHEKRPSQGKIQVAHMLIRANEAIPARDSIAAAEKAWEIHKLVRANPKDWDQLCRQFSEDVGTKLKGGALPWFKTGDVSNIPTFEAAAFGLKEIGTMSEPVKTPYGWHIIKLVNRQGLESFEEMEPRIKASLSRNSRGDLNRQALIRRLTKENDLVEYSAALQAALTHASDSLGLGLWKQQAAWNDHQEILFSIAETPYRLGGFYQYLEKSQPLRKGADGAQKMSQAYQKYLEDQLIAYEESHLTSKYPEYKMLYQEYRDGLLLFQLMEEKVWNKAVEDTAGLNTFFESNRQGYQWGERVQATIYNAMDKHTLDQVQSFVQNQSMEYLKYDFSGSEKSLNKAQIKILDNIAQQLKQSADRYLVLQYPKQETSELMRTVLLAHLSNHDVDDRVREYSTEEQQGFLAYVASSSPKDLADKLNKKQPLALQYEQGRFIKGQNELIDTLEWVPGVTTLQKDGRWVLVHLQKVLTPQDQELNEIKGKVISDYQEQLEQDWIKELKAKYQVSINEKAVDHVYEQFQK